MSVLGQTERETVSDIAVCDDLGPHLPSDLVHHPMPRWKRIFDAVAALVFIILFSPVLIGIAVYIWLVSGSPVTFQQSRLGEMGRYFTIFKFRTLESSRDTSNESTSQHRDYVAGLQGSGATLEKPDFGNRLIRGGEFLRSHALDELPQFFNVLIGNMSLVGPRPEVLHWDDYPPWQRKRLEATPGMTGLWQVSGKNKLSFGEMVDLDIKYIERRSLWMDIGILWKTVRVVLAADE